MKECAWHTDDALGDAWSCTSAFVCIGVFNRRLSVFTIFMLLSVLNTVCFTVCKFFLPLCLVFSFVLVWFVLCGVLEVGEYCFPSGRAPVLNKCWKAGTGVLIAKRSQRKSIFPKEQSDQEMKGFPRRPESKEGGWKLEQTMFCVVKMRDDSCWDKPLSGRAQSCDSLQQ